MVISRWDLPSGYVNSLLLKMVILTKVGDFVPCSNRMVMFQFVFKGQKKPEFTRDRPLKFHFASWNHICKVLRCQKLKVVPTILKSCVPIKIHNQYIYIYINITIFDSSVPSCSRHNTPSFLVTWNEVGDGQWPTMTYYGLLALHDDPKSDIHQHEIDAFPCPNHPSYFFMVKIVSGASWVHVGPALLARASDRRGSVHGCGQAMFGGALFIANLRYPAKN